MFRLWRAKPVEFKDVDDGYSLVSNYYECKEIRGVKHYRITTKGLRKIKEGYLAKDTHNFMVYLARKGVRKVSGNKFENGRII